MKKVILLLALFCGMTFNATASDVNDPSSAPESQQSQSRAYTEKNMTLRFNGANSATLSISVDSSYRIVGFRQGFTDHHEGEGSISGSTVTMTVTKSMAKNGDTVYCEVDAVDSRGNFLGTKVYVQVIH